jgi:hypothetical protein
MKKPRLMQSAGVRSLEPSDPDASLATAPLVFREGARLSDLPDTGADDLALVHEIRNRQPCGRVFYVKAVSDRLDVDDMSVCRDCDRFGEEL